MGKISSKSISRLIMKTAILLVLVCMFTYSQQGPWDTFAATRSPMMNRSSMRVTDVGKLLQKCYPIDREDHFCRLQNPRDCEGQPSWRCIKSAVLPACTARVGASCTRCNEDEGYALIFSSNSSNFRSFCDDKGNCPAGLMVRYGGLDYSCSSD